MNLSTQAGFSSDTFTPDRLIAGGDILGKGITLISGQNLVRGTVLGRITASGKYTKSLSAAADGSQIPSVVLTQDCDASGGDAPAIAYFAGTFNGAALTIGAGHTIASVTDALRSVDIAVLDCQGGV